MGWLKTPISIHKRESSNKVWVCETTNDDTFEVPLSAKTHPSGCLIANKALC